MREGAVSRLQPHRHFWIPPLSLSLSRSLSCLIAIYMCVCVCVCARPHVYTVRRDPIFGPDSWPRQYKKDPDLAIKGGPLTLESPEAGPCSQPTAHGRDEKRKHAEPFERSRFNYCLIILQSQSAQQHNSTREAEVKPWKKIVKERNQAHGFFLLRSRQIYLSRRTSSGL